MNRSQIKAFQQELFIRKVQSASDAIEEKIMASAPWLVAFCVGILLVKNLII